MCSEFGLFHSLGQERLFERLRTNSAGDVLCICRRLVVLPPATDADAGRELSVPCSCRKIGGAARASPYLGQLPTPDRETFPRLPTISDPLLGPVVVGLNATEIWQERCGRRRSSHVDPRTTNSLVALIRPIEIEFGSLLVTRTV